LALRVATVHFVVAVLLACPFACLAQAAASLPPWTWTLASDSGCDCCSRSIPRDSHKCPGKPADSRQGSGTCLCHGAVMDRPAVPPDPGHEVVGFVPLDTVLVVRGPLAIERSFFTGRTPCHFPAADSGREVRALIASLLL